MAGNTATISVATFRSDWDSHVPMRALCERYTITRDQVIRLKIVWELSPRHDRRLRAKPARQRDPTPTEIRAACAAMRAKHLAAKRAEPPDRVYRQGEAGLRVYVVEQLQEGIGFRPE